MFRRIVLLLALVGIAFIVWTKRAELLPSVQTKIPFFGQDSTSVLTALLDKSGLRLTSPPIISGSTIQASVSGVLVDFSTTKDLVSQVRALQLVLGSLKMDSRVISEIDLRFNKVVVRYER